MFCKECGKDIKDNAAVCIHCGVSLNKKIRAAFQEELLLLIHHHADVDCVSSAIALESVLENATICASDGISSHGQKIVSRVDSKIFSLPSANFCASMK